MPASRWFAVGSAGESEPGAGAYAAGEALMHDDAKLVVVFCSESQDLPAVRPGWRRVGEPMLVTGSGGSCVFALDDRPALDVYLQRLGVEPARVGEDGFTRLALTHPLGLSRHSGEEQVRLIALAAVERAAEALDAEVAAIVCGGELAASG